MTFAELARVGTVGIGGEPRVQFADLRFPTPTGQIELASAAPRPTATPTSRSHARPAPADGRLRLLTPASAWPLNDSFANEPKLARRVGAATIALHPADAAERGLASGDRVRLANATGELELPSRYPTIPRGVAFSPKGRWPGRGPGANVNALNPGIRSTWVPGPPCTASR